MQQKMSREVHVEIDVNHWHLVAFTAQVPACCHPEQLQDSSCMLVCFSILLSMVIFAFNGSDCSLLVYVAAACQIGRVPVLDNLT